MLICVFAQIFMGMSALVQQRRNVPQRVSAASALVFGIESEFQFSRIKYSPNLRPLTELQLYLGGGGLQLVQTE